MAPSGEEEVANAGEATSTPGVVDMKVTTNKSAGFYIRAATSFLAGVEAKDGKEAKEPVCVLNISGLGDAVSAACSAAAAVESKGLGYIKKIETSYPEMEGSGRGCPRVLITVFHKGA
ncbi:unnamed protein product [Prorocentrum cordatum]|uniref:DNA/RNA-binding protein Alba-like domain-containing protein n=1 Tax=Prorocentrum cordatum TaxID=2364126 RepID=A0ABN9TIV6_9DINO|nr:unnamed protein product [Polarella glacialis]|mmetsp:Transcript_52485/g.136670  ORF Transcript_52485/g.136670 Transcript_52485/m.136670 type:complete len:118 (-) Transcript_52485:80-433(-)